MVIEESINSITDYIELIEKITKKNETNGKKIQLIFRGQRTDMPLLPKLARLKFDRKIIEMEKVFLNEFKRGSIPLIEFKPDNIWDWLALAQHHNLPTRLLDWSRSALAALWFAVYKDPKKNEIGEEKGVVWIFLTEKAEYINNTTDDQNVESLPTDKTRIIGSSIVSRRISSQMGLFTIHKINDNGKIQADDFKEEFKNRLTKVFIPPNNFAEIRKQLDVLGVNYSTMFPDIDSYCKHLEWRYAINENEPNKIIFYEIY